MKRGDLIVAEVEQLSIQGDGIARTDGREVVIPRTVPGDKVEACVRRKRKGRFEADVVNFLEYGIERQDPPCQHFGVCGGCRWQDLAYVDQLQFKEGMVEGVLKGRILPPLEIKPILESPAWVFYRNKMEFSFGVDRQGDLQLGLHVRGRYNQVFDVAHCWLQSAVSNRIVQAVREYACVARLSVYDLKRHQGLLRFLVIREGKNTGEIMVNLVVSDYPCVAVDQLIECVLQKIPEITTVIVTLHQGKSQVAKGQQEFVIKDSGRIVERWTGLFFEISAQSFLQTNSLQAERLYDLISELAGDLTGKEVLDLYCGTGGISLRLASASRGVLGVEALEEAVVDARHNALRNGIQNSEFVAGPVEDVLTKLLESGKHFDLVVLDPPRAGMHKRARPALVALAPPRIIYVSCNPVTLADDLEVLSTAGYLVEDVQPVDMFPQTPHCEVVVELTRSRR